MGFKLSYLPTRRLLHPEQISIIICCRKTELAGHFLKFFSDLSFSNTAQEAANILQKRGVLQQYGATFDLLLSDTHDHFRAYNMLERLLHNPPRLLEQMSFQIEPEAMNDMIQKYVTADFRMNSSLIITECLHDIFIS